MPLSNSEATVSALPFLWQVLPLFLWFVLRGIEPFLKVNDKIKSLFYGLGLGIGALATLLCISYFQALGYYKIAFVGLSYLINDSSKIMMLLIFLVGGIVLLFSAYYFQKYPIRKIRLIFLGLSFFLYSMLGIVSAGNLLQMFVFWEFVGLCSFLLISFENEKFSVGKASLSVMLINRLGDVIFLLLVAILYVNLESTEIPEIAKLLNLVDLEHNKIHTGLLWLGGALTLIAFSKSAQIPFSAWLIEAMEGPTPISALMHAATMVTAGVFLLVQLHIFLIPEIQILILIGGLSTAALAGLSIYSEKNFKKMLGYSTIAQLGFMMAGLVAINEKVAFSHLLAHAPYKAGLFLMAALLMKISDSRIGKHSITSGRFATLANASWPWQVNLMMFLLSLAALGLPVFYSFYTKEAIYGAIQMNVAMYAPDLKSLIKVLYWLATFGSMVFYLQMALIFGKKLFKPNSGEIITIGRAHKQMLWCVSLLVISSFAFEGLFFETLLMGNGFSLVPIYLNVSGLISYSIYVLISAALLYVLPYYRNLGIGTSLRLHFLLKHFLYNKVARLFLVLSLSVSDVERIETNGKAINRGVLYPIRSFSLVNEIAKITVVFGHFIFTLDKLLVDGLIVRLNSVFMLFSSRMLLNTLGQGKIQLWVGSAFLMFTALAYILFW